MHPRIARISRWNPTHTLGRAVYYGWKIQLFCFVNERRCCQMMSHCESPKMMITAFLVSLKRHNYRFSINIFRWTNRKTRINKTCFTSKIRTCISIWSHSVTMITNMIIKWSCLAHSTDRSDEKYEKILTVIFFKDRWWLHMISWNVPLDYIYC